MVDFNTLAVSNATKVNATFKQDYADLKEAADKHASGSPTDEVHLNNNGVKIDARLSRQWWGGVKVLESDTDPKGAQTISEYQGSGLTGFSGYQVTRDPSGAYSGRTVSEPLKGLGKIVSSEQLTPVLSQFKFNLGQARLTGPAAPAPGASAGSSAFQPAASSPAPQEPSLPPGARIEGDYLIEDGRTTRMFRYGYV